MQEGRTTVEECECEGATQPVPRGLLREGQSYQGAHGGSSGTDWGLGPVQKDDISQDSITPELAELPECSGPPKLFPVFRRKAEWKVDSVFMPSAVTITS